ncbi:MAG: ammonia-forming cytochrome c nitrite reductase subunit c552 [Rhodospirillales bacterium]
MKYAGIALAAAVAAFLLASLLVHEPAAPAPRSGRDLESRFPARAEGYRRPAAVDARWREMRGHAFSLKDRDESDPDADPRWRRILAGRPKLRPAPAACAKCHGSRPLGCADCHDPETAALTVPCSKCHREYYLAPALAFPKGRTADEIEAFYAAAGHIDWEHAETGAAVLLPRHPQFELHSQGVHARGGAGCEDCHMPLIRRGALRITEHNARSPLEQIGPACLACHRGSEEEMKRRAELIQRRTDELLGRALDALIALIEEIHDARARGVRDEQLKPALALQTKAQWRAAFVAADKSKGFHAPQEAARLLAEAIDYARQGQLSARRAGTLQ